MTHNFSCQIFSWFLIKSENCTLSDFSITKNPRKPSGFCRFFKGTHKMQMVASVSHRRPFCPLLERLFYVSFRTAELKLAERAVPRKTTQKLHQFRPKFLPGKMDYQQYTGYQTMGYNSAYHYQYATPNHLKVGKKNPSFLPEFYWWNT